MDDELDAALRRRAGAARAEVEAQVDIESALASRPTTSGLAPVVPFASRRRLVAVAGSIAAVAVAIVGGVVLLRGSDSIETAEPTIDATTSIPSVIPTTVPGPTTAATTTSPPATTTTIPATPATPAAVSYLDPPAATTLTPLGTVPAPGATLDIDQVAVGDLGVAVLIRLLDEPDISRVDIIGFDGSHRTVDDLGVSNMIAYGPGDVMYSTFDGRSIDDFAVGAIPLSGDRVGEQVASEPANINRYLEYPPASFGHSSGGVTMRRDGGEVAIGYVDVDGDPTALDSTTTFFESDTFGLDEGQVTVTASTGEIWSLSIDAHPDHASPFVGPSPAAPTTGGTGVFWTHIGPDLAPEVDFGEPSQWVVAQLHPGGSATWWSLPEGWTIAASDIWGTVAVRQAGDQLEVALVDFATDDLPATTTTVPASAVPWRNMPWEGTRFERHCDGDAGCTQVRVDADGSLVTYEPTTRTLTRHSTPVVTAVLPEHYGRVYMELLGPDDVVYLNIDAVVPGDGAADLVAIALAPDDAGRELGRWDDITDRVGDQDLVATTDGIVTVGCCGPDVVRPAPDAEIDLAWVGRDGNAVRSPHATIRVEITYPTMTVVRGEQSWTVTPPADWTARGMPTVMPTFDGGFIAATFGTGHSIVRGWPDGSVETVSLADSVDTIWPVLDPSGRFMIENGDRFARVEPFADRSTAWDGTLDVDVGGTGEITVTRQPSTTDAPWATDPVAFANAVAGPIEVNERRTITIEQQSEFQFGATVTTVDFFDDSVFGTRRRLDLALGDDGRFSLDGGTWAQACQPGRGHQDFLPALCT